MKLSFNYFPASFDTFSLRSAISYAFYAVLICFFDREYPIQRGKNRKQGLTTTNNLFALSPRWRKLRVLQGEEPFCYREKRKRLPFPGEKTAKKRFQKIFRPRFNGDSPSYSPSSKNNEIIQRLIVETESKHNANPTLVNHSFNWLFFQLSNIIRREPAEAAFSRRATRSSSPLRSTHVNLSSWRWRTWKEAIIEFGTRDIPLFFPFFFRIKREDISRDITRSFNI